MKKTFIALAASLMMLGTLPAEAAYGGARGSFSSSRVYSAPRSSFSRPSMPSYRPSYSVPSRPVYVAPRAPVFVSRPTVIHQTTVVRSGGGFFSNMFSTGAGVLGGMALWNWIHGDSNQQQPQQPVVAPAVPASAASAPVVTK